MTFQVVRYQSIELSFCLIDCLHWCSSAKYMTTTMIIQQNVVHLYQWLQVIEILTEDCLICVFECLFKVIWLRGHRKKTKTKTNNVSFCNATTGWFLMAFCVNITAQMRNTECRAVNFSATTGLLVTNTTTTSFSAVLVALLLICTRHKSLRAGRQRTVVRRMCVVVVVGRRRDEITDQKQRAAAVSCCSLGRRRRARLLVRNGVGRR